MKSLNCQVTNETYAAVARAAAAEKMTLVDFVETVLQRSGKVKQAAKELGLDGWGERPKVGRPVTRRKAK